MNSSSDTESIESFGRDADTVIANSGGSSSAAIDSLSGIGTLAKFTEGLVRFFGIVWVGRKSLLVSSFCIDVVDA